MPSREKRVEKQSVTSRAKISLNFTSPKGLGVTNLNERPAMSLCNTLRNNIRQPLTNHNNIHERVACDSVTHGELGTVHLNNRRAPLLHHPLQSLTRQPLVNRNNSNTDENNDDEDRQSLINQPEIPQNNVHIQRTQDNPPEQPDITDLLEVIDNPVMLRPQILKLKELRNHYTEDIRYHGKYFLHQ